MHQKAVSLIFASLLLITLLAVIPFAPPASASPSFDGAEHIVDGIGAGNNFATIQEAIDSAAAGDVIRVHAGLFEENVLINKRVALIGNGSDATFIEGQPAGDAVTINANGVLFSGFNVTGLPAGNGIKVQSSTGSEITDNHIHGTAWGIRADSLVGTEIRNNTLSLNGDGILIGYSTGCTIAENTLHSQTMRNIVLMFSNGCSVHDNVIVGGFDGITVQDPSGGNDIRGNTISGVTAHAMSIVNAYDNTVVDNTFIGSGRGVFLSNAKDNLIGGNNISGNAQEGLLVADGSSNNSFINNTVDDNGNRGFNIMSSPDNLFIGNDVTGHDAYAFLVDSSPNNHFSSNVMTDQDQGAYLTSSADSVFSSNIIDAVDHCIYLGNSPGSIVEDNVLTGAEFGVRMLDGTGVTVRGNDISGVFQGVVVTLSDGVLIVENTMSGSDSVITVDNSAGALVMDNVLTGGVFGIRVAFSDDNVLVHNTVSSSTVGILLQDSSSSNTVASNVISHCTQSGMEIGNSPSNVVRGNTFSDNLFGLRVLSGDGNLIFNNNFIFNSNHATDAATSIWNETAANGGGNYWQDFACNPGFPDEYEIAGGANVDMLPLNGMFDNVRPTADGGGDRTVEQNEPVLFTAQASADNVGITNFTWAFNDGVDSVTWYGMALVHSFPLVGVYEVTLTVRDAAGNEDADVFTVNVTDTEPPVAVAGADAVVDMGGVVEFDASGSSDNVGITFYQWTFNDGVENVTINGQSGNHSFTRAGHFIVSLTVGDAAGNNATDTLVVSVNLTLTIGPVVGPDGPVEGALVTVLFSGLEYQSVTGSNGVAVVNLPPEAADSSIGITVSKDGFQTFTMVATAASDGLPSVTLPSMLTLDDGVADLVLLGAVALMIAVMSYMVGRTTRKT